mmetsp:Transcript_22034/g.55301  ORF Transcript_22034/g.55301 Transcript_22034/m.55301 type:complete len:546 (-) Transcript_22034:481-2118(-)
MVAVVAPQAVAERRRLVPARSHPHAAIRRCRPSYARRRHARASWRRRCAPPSRTSRGWRVIVLARRVTWPACATSTTRPWPICARSWPRPAHVQRAALRRRVARRACAPRRTARPCCACGVSWPRRRAERASSRLIWPPRRTRIAVWSRHANGWRVSWRRRALPRTVVWRRWTTRWRRRAPRWSVSWTSCARAPRPSWPRCVRARRPQSARPSRRGRRGAMRKRTGIWHAAQPRRRATPADRTRRHRLRKQRRSYARRWSRRARPARRKRSGARRAPTRPSPTQSSCAKSWPTRWRRRAARARSCAPRRQWRAARVTPCSGATRSWSSCGRSWAPLASTWTRRVRSAPSSTSAPTRLRATSPSSSRTTRGCWASCRRHSWPAMRRRRRPAAATTVSCRRSWPSCGRRRRRPTHAPRSWHRRRAACSARWIASARLPTQSARELRAIVRPPTRSVSRTTSCAHSSSSSWPPSIACSSGVVAPKTVQTEMCTQMRTRTIRPLCLTWHVPRPHLRLVPRLRPPSRRPWSAVVHCWMRSAIRAPPSSRR